jgi:hypothetical protein
MKLSVVLDGVHDFQEGHGIHFFTSLDHGCLHVGSTAHTASIVERSRLGWSLVGTCRLLADQLALGTRAESRLLAFPVALSLLAHGSADSVRSGTGSTALGRCTHSLALGAVS